MTDKFEVAYKEFHDKTEWIQTEMNKGVVKAFYWGMHRADAIKALVDSLREEIKQKDANDELTVDVYDYLAEKIEPHIEWKPHGMSCCDEGSLTASVTESFEYLLEFWLRNREKENVEHP